MTEQEQLEFINTTCNTDYKSMEEVDWYFISGYEYLSEEFIKEFADKVNWGCISLHQKLSEPFIREFKDKVDWVGISVHQKLSENFIREFKDKVDWCYICTYQKLSENFIREYQDKVYWSNISWHQKLSEDFIREFQDEVDWYFISEYQTLSPEFKKEFKHKWNFDIVENTDECKIAYEPNEDITTFDNFRNIILTEKDLLDKLDNRDLPKIINKIQCLKSLITKLTQDIDNYDFTSLELKYIGNDRTISEECNDDIIDFDNDMFTSEELRVFMINTINFYECKLDELEKQYLDIFYGDKI